MVKVDGVVSDGQADTGTSAGAVLFGGDPKERFKQIFQGIGGNTGPRSETMTSAMGFLKGVLR